MKKIAIIGIVALVVIGCVLAAGCTSTSTTPASSASTTTTDAVVGTWTLPNGTTVVFSEDFKGVMTTGENKINFTWKKNTDGKYQVDNEKGQQVIWTMDSSKNSMTNAAGNVLTKKANSASGAALDVTLVPRDVLSETEIAALIEEFIVENDMSEMSEDEIIELIDAMSAEEQLSLINVSPVSGTMTEDEMMATLSGENAGVSTSIFDPDASPIYILDGIGVIDFSSINPDDFETIEVLKDASSTAIYGSRGTNDILITT